MFFVVCKVVVDGSFERREAGEEERCRGYGGITSSIILFKKLNSFKGYWLSKCTVGKSSWSLDYSRLVERWNYCEQIDERWDYSGIFFLNTIIHVAWQSILNIQKSLFFLKVISNFLSRCFFPVLSIACFQSIFSPFPKCLMVTYLVNSKLLS